MTDRPTTPPSPDEFSDEELSAAIDGELTPARAQDLELDERAQIRLDAMRRTVGALGAAAVDPLDGSTVDDLINGALDTPVAPPASLAARRRSAAPLLVAASILVVLAIGVALIVSGGSRSDEDASSAGASADAPEAADLERNDEGTEPSAETDGALGSEASTTTAASTEGLIPLALGSFDAPEDLRMALASSFTSEQANAQPAAPSVPTAEAIDRCAEQLRITLDLDAGPQQTGYGEVGGQAVLVYEFATESFADGSPTTLVAAVGADACQQVVLFER